MERVESLLIDNIIPTVWKDRLSGTFGYPYEGSGERGKYSKMPRIVKGGLKIRHFEGFKATYNIHLIFKL